MRCLLVLVLAACAAPAPPEPAAAKRIVCLLPSFTEILVELGAGDRIVACTEHCEPGRDVPRVPWRTAAAAEAILRLRPDLVLRQTRRRGEDALRAELEEAGIAVRALPSETIEDVRVAILRIGEAIGRAPAAQSYLEGFDDAMVQARAGAVGRSRRSVLFVFGRDAGVVANVHAAGPDCFLDELIRYAGGRNVLGEGYPPYAKPRLEALVRLQPDVIIDNVPPEADPAAAWRDVPLAAVSAGRVHFVKDNALLVPGPHLPKQVQRLVEMIHGRP